MMKLTYLVLALTIFAGHMAIAATRFSFVDEQDLAKVYHVCLKQQLDPIASMLQDELKEKFVEIEKTPIGEFYYARPLYFLDYGTAYGFVGYKGDRYSGYRPFVFRYKMDARDGETELTFIMQSHLKYKGYDFYFDKWLATSTHISLETIKLPFFSFDRYPYTEVISNQLGEAQERNGFFLHDGVLKTHRELPEFIPLKNSDSGLPLIGQNGEELGISVPLYIKCLHSEIVKYDTMARLQNEWENETVNQGFEKSGWVIYGYETPANQGAASF